MSSDKQSAANRRNSQSSTGPRDTRATSRNATRHGLLAAGVIGRERTAHAKLARQLHQHYGPMGPVERWLVDDIAMLMVRSRRAVEIETLLLTRQIQDNQVLGDPLGQYLAMEAGMLGKTEPVVRCALTPANIHEVNQSVGRYETALQNRLYRAMHELERLRRLRQGECIPAPAAGDLTVHAPAAAAPAREPAGAINCVGSEET